MKTTVQSLGREAREQGLEGQVQELAAEAYCMLELAEVEAHCRMERDQHSSVRQQDKGHLRRHTVLHHSYHWHQPSLHHNDSGLS